MHDHELAEKAKSTFSICILYLVYQWFILIITFGNEIYVCFILFLPIMHEVIKNEVIGSNYMK